MTNTIKQLINLAIDGFWEETNTTIEIYNIHFELIIEISKTELIHDELLDYLEEIEFLFLEMMVYL